MKVLFIARSTLERIRGGDTVQVHETAAALRKLGVEVDVRLSGEKFSLNGYDLIHGFNMIRPADLLVYAEKSPVPFVLSTIFVDYCEYDRRCRTGASGWMSRHVNKDTLEYLKTLARAALGQDIISSRQYILLGHRKAMQQLLSHTKLLLPNSENEMRRVRIDTGTKLPYRVIPNAVSEGFLEAGRAVERVPNQILCVGQIEGRKNQHLLIEATRTMDVMLIIAGKPSPNNVGYFDYCRQIAHKGVRFDGYVSGEILLNLYHTSYVHALPSWFETTGLSSLEAGAAGCNLVVSDRGDTRDYFDGHAEFCSPDSVESIREALQRALDKPLSAEFAENVKSHYTWRHTAEATLSAYREVLKQ